MILNRIADSIRARDWFTFSIEFTIGRPVLDDSPVDVSRAWNPWRADLLMEARSPMNAGSVSLNEPRGPGDPSIQETPRPRPTDGRQGQGRADLEFPPEAGGEAYHGRRSRTSPASDCRHAKAGRKGDPGRRP
jgi:hypothetical protein